MATDLTQQRLASRKGAHFRFAGFVLDTLPLELRKGTERVEAQPKALHLLRLLLENAEQAVTKEDLLDALWPDTMVGEGSLTSAVRQARRALEEHGRSSKIICTVHRVGYRIGVPVERLEGAPCCPMVNQRWRPAKRYLTR